MFTYGCLRGILPTLRQAQREGRTWIYADNGYFRPMREKPSGYFRVTVNALQHTGSGKAGPERWRRLDLKIKPWRKTGRHIVVCPPARLVAIMLEIDADRWLAETLATLRAQSDRPVRVRAKMSWRDVKFGFFQPLASDLIDAWALVTHSSNAAVEALLAGVPVYCTGACAAARMGWADPAMIETPVLPDDREQWAWNVAANQWTLEEMRDGTCWRDLAASA